MKVFEVSIKQSTVYLKALVNRNPTQHPLPWKWQSRYKKQAWCVVSALTVACNPKSLHYHIRPLDSQTHSEKCMCPIIMTYPASKVNTWINEYDMLAISYNLWPSWRSLWMDNFSECGCSVHRLPWLEVSDAQPTPRDPTYALIPETAYSASCHAGDIVPTYTHIVCIWAVGDTLTAQVEDFQPSLRCDKVAMGNNQKTPSKPPPPASAANHHTHTHTLAQSLEIFGSVHTKSTLSPPKSQSPQRGPFMQATQSFHDPLSVRLKKKDIFPSFFLCRGQRNASGSISLTWLSGSAPNILWNTGVQVQRTWHWPANIFTQEHLRGNLLHCLTNGNDRCIRQTHKTQPNWQKAKRLFFFFLLHV